MINFSFRNNFIFWIEFLSMNDITTDAFIRSFCCFKLFFGNYFIFMEKFHCPFTKKIGKKIFLFSRILFQESFRTVFSTDLAKAPPNTNGTQIQAYLISGNFIFKGLSLYAPAYTRFFIDSDWSYSMYENKNLPESVRPRLFEWIERLIVVKLLNLILGLVKVL